jgi:FkbM family methyltransferase
VWRKLKVLRNRARGNAICGDVVRLPIDHSIMSYLIEKALATGRYEGNEAELARSLIQPNDTVLELGAGLGFLSTYLRLTSPAGRIVCYEANWALMPYIANLHALNKAYGIDVRNAVVFPNPTAETVPFHVHPDFWASGLEPVDDRCRRVEVPVERLSDVMASVRPDVLVMDIEGGEADVLEAADLGAVHSVVLDTHDADATSRALAALRGKHGFREVMHTGWVWGFSRRP